MTVPGPRPGMWAALRPSNGVSVLGVILAGWLLCIASLHRPNIGDFMDDGEYFVAAQSLRDGGGYRLPSRPGNPPEVKYPAGVSMIAALTMPAKGASLESDFRAARVVSAFSAVVFAVSAFFTLRLLGMGGLSAACAIVPAIGSDVFLNESLSLLSDIPFAACCTLLTLVWASVRAGKLSLTLPVVLAVGTVAGATLALRSNGVVVCVAFFALALHAQKPWRSGAMYVLGTSIFPVVIRTLTKTAVSSAPAEPYSVNWVAYTSVKAGALIIWRNARDYFKAVPILIFPELNTNLLARHSVLASAIVLLIWLFIGRGIWILRPRLRRIDSAPILFCLLSAGVWLIWPWSLYLRPVIPFMPFLVAAFIVGVSSPRGVRLPTTELVLVGLLACVAGQVRMTVWGLTHQPQTLKEAFAFIREHTEPTAVVVAQLAETTYLFSGRQSIKLLNDADSVSGNLGDWTWINNWRRVAVGRPFYLLGSAPGSGGADLPARQVIALAASSPGKLRELYRTSLGDFAVFKIDDTP